MNEVDSMIKNAFNDSNAERSRKLHQMKLKKIEKDSNEDTISISQSNEEKHKGLGDYVKSIIFGGLDGIITTFAIVCFICNV